MGGVDVAGVDLNLDDLRHARCKLSDLTCGNPGKSGACIVSSADLTLLPFEDEVFDVVICSEVLEHIPDNKAAISEIVRVLKRGKYLVVSVPRYLPERICWAISKSYHQEPGGHIRIYKKDELIEMLESAGTKCKYVRYKHSIHSPYWWLKCFVGHKNEHSRLVKLYKKFLEWDIIEKPQFTRWLDRILNPFIAKSVVLYLKKG
jgi:ubiquinone/menaquinone biosynthesis C-methylase UbiE